MLVQLHIENFALIDRIVLEFGPGMNVLTGETGAGKSMIVGALGLVLGRRAQADMLRDDGKATLIEALFEIAAYPQIGKTLDRMGIVQEESSLLLKRVMTKGSSRCYINGNLATLTMLQEIGQHLVDILGQHQHQTLLRRNHQLALLDAYGKLGDDREALRHAFQRYQALVGESRQLQEEERQRLQRQDLIRFQMEEIDKAQLRLDEEEQQSEERRLLQNAEKLRELSHQAYELLYRGEQAVLERLMTMVETLSQLAELDTRQRKTHDEARESYYILEEVAQQVRAYSEQVEIDPARLQTIEDRLAEIARLKRKYGPTVASIIQFRAQLDQEHVVWEQREEQLAAVTAELEGLRQTLKTRAITLSDKRRQTALRLQQAVQDELSDLRMSGTVFQIACSLRHDPQGDVTVGAEPVTLAANGIDEVEYLFAPNAGQSPKPLARIASGGELSRVMLALKSILAREDHTPTLVLDEVDAGIGGQTARIVGEKLRRIARSHQVFCITHLPQIASHGDQHYHVEKMRQGRQDTIRVRSLAFTERVDEIARMSNGKRITDVTRKHAEEMLNQRA